MAYDPDKPDPAVEPEFQAKKTPMTLASVTATLIREWESRSKIKGKDDLYETGSAARYVVWMLKTKPLEEAIIILSQKYRQCADVDATHYYKMAIDQLMDLQAMVEANAFEPAKEQGPRKAPRPLAPPPTLRKVVFPRNPLSFAVRSRLL